MIYLYATLVMTLVVFWKQLNRYELKFKTIDLSPDGSQYLEMILGRPGPGLYGLRWLLPWLSRLGRRPVGTPTEKLSAKDFKPIFVWRYITWLSLIGLGPLLVWYLPGVPNVERLFLVALLGGLPGVVEFSTCLPILVDGLSNTLTLASAAAWLRGLRWPALGLALVGGMTRETAPVFAASAAWSFWPLVGLLPVVLRFAQLRRRAHAVAKPKEGECFSEGGKGVAQAYDGMMAGKLSLKLLAGPHAHRTHWFDPKAMLFHWGACVLCALNPSWPLAVALVLGYGQLIMAHDRARLYQCAFPQVLRSMVGVVPRRWMIPALLVHYFHPQQVTVSIEKAGVAQ